MLLTAYDGEHQPPFMADDDRADLKQFKLTLSSGTRDIPRRSKLGTKHIRQYDLGAREFKHKPESSNHLRVKTVVMLAPAKPGGRRTRSSVRPTGAGSRM